jgi:hypothetical protein
MFVRRCVVPLLTVGVMACGDDAVTPTDGVALENHYTLTWTATRDAPTVTTVAGVSIPIEDCGAGAQPPNATFAFSDSTALTLQRSPQGYALTIIGMLTDCGGIRTRVFDVLVGDYVIAGDAWITLMGDLTHPNFDGQITAPTGEPVTIFLRPGQPGLSYPLAGLDRLAFTGP